MDKVGLGELGPSVPQVQVDEDARCGAPGHRWVGISVLGLGDYGRARLKGDRGKVESTPEKNKCPSEAAQRPG